MHFDARQYLSDLSIQTWTSGKNVRQNPPGWVNVACRLCNDSSNHGQFAPPGWSGAPYLCWKCGNHSLENVIQAIEGIGYLDACKRVRQYTTDVRLPIQVAKPREPGLLQLPLGTHKLGNNHREYLRRRRFDSDELERKYNLLGTGPAGHLPHRIVIPVFHQGRMVSWQARDITDQAELRYISAGPDKEEIRHKDILYNLDNCRGRNIIVVEGITDVWRLGDGCCATFGTKVRLAQVRLLAEYSRVFFVYDGEAQAQALARRLCRALSGMGVQAENILLDDGDPGDMDAKEAQKLKQELLG